MLLCVMTGGAAAAARAVEEDVQKAEPSAEQSTGRSFPELLHLTSMTTLNIFVHSNLCKKYGRVSYLRLYTALFVVDLYLGIFVYCTE